MIKFRGAAGVLLGLLLCGALYAQPGRGAADSLLRRYTLTKDVSAKSDLLAKASFALLFQHPDTAFILANESLALAEESRNDTILANALTNLSAVYLIRDDVPNTMSYALQALRIADRTPLPPDLMASIFRKLGYVYRSQNQDSLSIDVYRRSIRYSEQAKNQHDIAASANNLGTVFVKVKLPDSALHYYQKGLAIAVKENYTDLIVRSYINIINVYDDLKQPGKAFEHVHRLMPYLEGNVATPIVKGLAYTTIIKLDLRNGENGWDLAGRYLDSMRHLIKITEPGTDNLMDYYLNKALYDFGNNRLVEGGLALDQYYQLKRKKEDELISGQVQKLAVQYETGKKEQQIKDLDQQNRLRQLLLIVFVSAAIVLLLVAVWIWRQNQKIKKQEQKLSYLMKELHHRVKNNLQIVSSLLSLQSGRTEDAGARRALQEGQFRIEAMSLIHRKLYETDDVSGVLIGQYMSELSEYLMHAFGYSHENFQLRVHSDISHIDADTAIPLGLILNETVTNAFKYAYGNVQVPSLDIKLQLKSQHLRLQVSDNGRDFSNEKWQSSHSFGKQLIQSLTFQLKGKLDLETGHGTCFSITLPYKNAIPS